jgi:hypothetical protein
MNKKEKYIVSEANRSGFLVIAKSRLDWDTDLIGIIHKGYMYIDHDIHIGQDLIVLFLNMIGKTIKSYYISIPGG